jgi:opacity protein-like surface antigen
MVVRTLALTFLLVLCAPGSGRAEEGDEDLARTGLYVGIGIVLGLENFGSSLKADVNENLESRPNCVGNQTAGCVNKPLGPAKVSLQETGGLDAHAGYRVHRYLAVEGQLEWLDFPGFKSNEQMAGNGLSRNLKVEVDTLVITGNLKPYFMTGRIQPFGVVGAGVMMEELGIEYQGNNQNERNTGFVMRFGGGVDYYATENVVLSAQGTYVTTFGSVHGRDYTSLGLLGLAYRF